MCTAPQLESIRVAIKQLIDLGDEATAATLAWAEDLTVTSTGQQRMAGLSERRETIFHRWVQARQQHPVVSGDGPLTMNEQFLAALEAFLDLSKAKPDPEPRLTCEARIGHTSFGVGVPERFVIEAAQRAAEHPQGQLDKEAAAELQRLIQENAERAAFLDAHPAVTAELSALIEENERLRAAAPVDVIDWRCALTDLVARAEAAGYVLTVERVPGPGALAMRNHVARVSSYEKR